MQYRDAELRRRYERTKFESKLKIAAAKDAFNLNKEKKAPAHHSDGDDMLTSSEDEMSSSSERATSTSTSNRIGGKDELAKAEGVMRSNSSYIDLTQTLTKRMRDETLDHSKVLSESKHPITRICLTGGPCAGKTTALATLSTVL